MLSNNDGDAGCSFLAPYRPDNGSSPWAWSKGRRSSGAVLHSSREPGVRRPCSDFMDMLHPIQYERAPLRVRCAMLRKHPPVDPVLSILSCFRKPSVGVFQVASNSPDPGIAWPSTRFRPDL